MTELQARLKAIALAFEIASVMGPNMAKKILEEAATKVNDEQWKGPGSR